MAVMSFVKIPTVFEFFVIAGMLTGFSSAKFPLILPGFHPHYLKLFREMPIVLNEGIPYS
jgi:hypothetical protein